MASFLPPTPVGVPPGHSYWNDWYEKLRQLINNSGIFVAWTNITGTPTTLGGYGITDGATKNGSNRMNLGVDTTDDVIIDDATNGIVLKDTQGTPHYWRVTVDNTGALVTTDLGTTKP